MLDYVDRLFPHVSNRSLAALLVFCRHSYDQGEDVTPQLDRLLASAYYYPQLFRHLYSHIANGNLKLYRIQSLLDFYDWIIQQPDAPVLESWARYNPFEHCSYWEVHLTDESAIELLDRRSLDSRSLDERLRTVAIPEDLLQLLKLPEATVEDAAGPHVSYRALLETGRRLRNVLDSYQCYLATKRVYYAVRYEHADRVCFVFINTEDLSNRIVIDDPDFSHEIRRKMGARFGVLTRRYRALAELS